METDKKQRVEEMFDGIAPTYDALNHLLSFGIDRGWRRKVVKMAVRHFGLLRAYSPRNDVGTVSSLRGADGDEARHCEEQSDEAIQNNILDVATGTGDLAIALARRIPSAHITGVDISENMLEVGRKKIERMNATTPSAAQPPLLRKEGNRASQGARSSTDAGESAESRCRKAEGDNSPRAFSERITLKTGDAEALDFPDGEFDVVTVAFGVRNFGDIPAGLREMRRVLKPGGRCFILEFSEPRPGSFFGMVYRFYFHRVLPRLGRLVSRDAAAYTYLPRSVDGFPAPERFAEMLREAGFSEVHTKKLTFGVAYIYDAEK